MAKRRSRRPTDKTMPDGVDDAVVDADLVSLYSSLRDYERRLDATMARKRLDIIDNVNRYPKVQFGPMRSDPSHDLY
jgi:SWI/SNF-related matrix-associated actin-dependent regulator of chromatin subfamily D